MNRNQMTVNQTRHEQVRRCFAAALIVTLIFCVAATFSLTPAFAAHTAPTTSTTEIETGALDNVMNIVIEIITKAALYIGIVIVLWGVFQIVLAFRREDSEAIGKQITTVVVGGVLVGFGAIAGGLYTALTGSGS